MTFPTERSQYFTASIRNWLPLLAPDKYKQIITQSLYFMVEAKRVELNSFVIMDNPAYPAGRHIQLIWQPLPGQTLSSIPPSFMKLSAQKIKFNLAIDNPKMLEQWSNAW